ncbi:MAG: hypothetical protein WC460_03825 [Patescibacteria group bacterium]
MRKFELADLGGCFREEVEQNGVFGKIISRHLCEVPIIDGVYADERCKEPIARLDGCVEDLLSAADPDLDEIWTLVKREQKARSDAMNRELSVWDAQAEADFDREGEMEEPDELSFTISGRYFANLEKLDEFIGISADLHWPSDTWCPEEMKEPDPQEQFPLPKRPKQIYEEGTPPRFMGSSRRNCGRKPRGIQNCRVKIRRARHEKRNEFRSLAEEEIIEQECQIEEDYAAALDFAQHGQV